MKRKKLWAAVFGLLGLALAGLALWLCFTSLDAPARVLGVDDRAAERTEAWMDAVCAGDYAAAGAMMYGAPELSVGADPEDPAGVFFWETFVDSLSYQFHGDCYPTRTGYARDVTVKALDIPAMRYQLRKGTEEVIAQRIEEWEYLDDVYDENNHYQDAFVMDALREAAQILLEKRDFITTRKLTLELVYEDGQWLVVAGQDLMDVLSGNMD